MCAEICVKKLQPEIMANWEALLRLENTAST